MTKQEMYDKVKAHLLTQGAKSSIPGIDCAYRGEHGRKCAIGVLIPDEVYSPEMEGRTVGLLSIVYPNIELKYLEIEGTIRFANKLQQIHDFYSPCVWENKLHELAVQEGLIP